MIDSVVQSFIDKITATLSLSFISPFWYWLFWGVVIIAAVSAAGWYFKVLRPVAGFITAIVIAGLVGYRRGEHEAGERKAAREAKQRKPPEGGDWWRS